MATAESGRVRRTWRMAAVLSSGADAMPAAASRDVAGVVCVTRGSGRGCAVPGFSRACLLRLVDYPEMPLRTATSEIVKAGHTALIVRTEFSVGNEMRPAAYKRVTRKTWWKRLTSLFRTNQCLKTFRLGLEFLRNGIPTAKPLAVIVPHRLEIFRDTYIATEWIEDANSLHLHLRGIEQLPADERHRKFTEVAEAIGSVLGRMHARGFSHRDLKAGNLLVRDGLAGPEAFVIDLDGAAHRRGLSWRTRVRNLARLGRCFESYPSLNATHVLRGLRAYLKNQAPEIEWKRLWRSVAHEV